MTTATLPLILALWAASPPAAAERPFAIEVVDDRTGRGVPLVELRTVNNVRLLTDSNGIAAFAEPGLMGRTVYFHVASHGYEFPKDGFGFRGKALAVVAGGGARLEIHRINIAERLYRVTGEGIYRDSVLVGRPVPIRHPLLNAQVLGSDSVVNAVYHGKLRWFWGDTNRPRYPLGNFDVPGATSLLPEDGGLDPDKGVDLDYFVGEDGFARPMARMPGNGPTWIDGLVVLRDAEGRERMFAAYVKVRNLLEVYERGLAEYDDATERFKKVATFALDIPVFPGGHPILREENGVEYVEFATPYLLTRVRADPDDLAHPERYEAFTCLAEGSRLDKPRIDRAADGSPRYAWKKGTPALGPADEDKLVKAGVLKREDALLQLQDADTGKRVAAHAGSVSWNAYRKRWVMITVEVGGKSYLGEVWYAEADTPRGPWVFARKVVTHDKYSFYNPKQHPVFARDGGRILYFEGTYAETFSGNPVATPRYDYNQVMYRLDLADPRLNLPVAISRREGAAPFGVASQGNSRGAIAFFALERPGSGSVPVFATSVGGVDALAVGKGEGLPLFHALPHDAKDAPATTLPLYEFTGPEAKTRAYSTESSWPTPGYSRSERPVCRVWRNPMRLTLPAE